MSKLPRTSLTLGQSDADNGWKEDPGIVLRHGNSGRSANTESMGGWEARGGASECSFTGLGQCTHLLA
jgi:hypothetical protein